MHRFLFLIFFEMFFLVNTQLHAMKPEQEERGHFPISRKEEVVDYLTYFREVNWKSTAQAYNLSEDFFDDYLQLNKKVEELSDNNEGAQCFKEYATSCEKSFWPRLVAAQNFDYLNGNKVFLVSELMHDKAVPLKTRIQVFCSTFSLWNLKNEPREEEKTKLFTSLIQEINKFSNITEKEETATQLIAYYQVTGMQEVINNGRKILLNIAINEDVTATQKIYAASALNIHSPPDDTEGFKILLNFLANPNLEEDEWFTALSSVFYQYNNFSTQKTHLLLECLKEIINLSEFSPPLLYRLACGLAQYGELRNTELGQLTCALINKGNASKEPIFTKFGVHCANILMQFGKQENIEQAIVYCKNILSDLKVSVELKLLTIELILQSEIHDLKKFALDTLTPLLKDENIEDHFRLHAAGFILSWSQDLPLKEKVFRYVTTILNKYQVLPLKCLKPFLMFLELPDEKIRNIALTQALTVFEDKESEEKAHILSARLILSAGNQIQKNNAYKYLTDLIKNDELIQTEEGKPLHRKALEAIIHGLPEGDERHQLALQQLINFENMDDGEKDNRKNPYVIHAILLKKCKETLQHNPHPYVLKDGRSFVIDRDYFQKPQVLPDIPNVTYQDFQKLVKRLHEEIETNEEVAHQFDTLRGEVSSEAIFNAGNSSFFSNLFVTTNEHSKLHIDPSVFKIHQFVDITKNLSTKSVGSLSPQAAQTLQLLLNVITCPTGKENGLHATSLLLDKTPNFHENRTEEGLEQTRIKDRFAQLLNYEAFRLRAQTIIGNGQLAGHLTQTLPNTPIEEAAHQGLYLYNLIGDAIGIKFKGEMIKFDPNGGAIANPLLDLSRQNVIDSFYNILTTQKYLCHFTNFLNQNIRKGPMDHENKIIFSGLNAFLGAENLNEEKGLLNYDEDGIPISLTEKGTTEILLKLNHIQELLEKK